MCESFIALLLDRFYVGSAAQNVRGEKHVGRKMNGITKRLYNWDRGSCSAALLSQLVTIKKLTKDVTNKTLSHRVYLEFIYI